MERIYPVFVSYVAADGLVRGMTFLFLTNPISHPRGMTQLMDELYSKQGSIPTITFMQPMQPISADALDENIQEYIEVFQCQKKSEQPLFY